MYSPNFSAENKIFCLSLHCNDDNSYLFVNGKEVSKFKANLSSSDIEDSKLHENVYEFSVDYSAISNNKILDIHAYLMKKNGMI